MATLTVQNAQEAGATLTVAPADNAGDDFVNNGQEFIIVRNASSSGSKNISIAPTVSTIEDKQYGDLSKQTVVKAVAGGETAVIGPLKPDGFNDTNQKVSITYPNGVTNIKVSVVRFVY